jgi:hypothetical protein
LSPRSMPCAPMVRRSTRHVVADDGSSATDEDTFRRQCSARPP